MRASNEKMQQYRQIASKTQEAGETLKRVMRTATPIKKKGKEQTIDDTLKQAIKQMIALIPYEDHDPKIADRSPQLLIEEANKLINDVNKIFTAWLRQHPEVNKMLASPKHRDAIKKAFFDQFETQLTEIRGLIQRFLGQKQPVAVHDGPASPVAEPLTPPQNDLDKDGAPPPPPRDELAELSRVVAAAYAYGDAPEENPAPVASDEAAAPAESNLSEPFAVLKMSEAEHAQLFRILSDVYDNEPADQPAVEAAAKPPVEPVAKPAPVAQEATFRHINIIPRTPEKVTFEAQPQNIVTTIHDHNSFEVGEEITEKAVAKSRNEGQKPRENERHNQAKKVNGAATPKAEQTNGGMTELQRAWQKRRENEFRQAAELDKQAAISSHHK